MSANNWEQIETEYITTDTSYRKLAEKYGVDQATIARKAKKEDWVSKRQRHVSNTQAKVLAADTRRKVSRAERLQTVADKLLNKIEAVVETTDPEDMSAKEIRALTAAVKDIKEIHMIQSEADMREQEARIAKLNREAEKGEAGDTGAFGVVLLPAVAPIPAPPEEDSNG